jgi:hypothetical protein
MKCNTIDEGCAILKDIHVGICDSHVGVKSLMGKAYRKQFFWPTVVSDADSLVHRCEFTHTGAQFGRSFQES